MGAGQKLGAGHPLGLQGHLLLWENPGAAGSAWGHLAGRRRGESGEGPEFTAALKEIPLVPTVGLVLGQATSRVHGEVRCSPSFSDEVSVSPCWAARLWGGERGVVDLFLPFSLHLFSCLCSIRVLKSITWGLWLS